MELLISNENCVAVSLAMLLNVPLKDVQQDLYTDLEYPFSGEWAKFPKVPDMNQIADWLWWKHKRGLTPFEYAPMCSPSPDCQPVPVWEDPHRQFLNQLGFGDGLLEGVNSEGIGHMVAWDCKNKFIFDPRGTAYPVEWANAQGFFFKRFWLLQ